jgi:arginyl-tRNA synthetase
MNGNLFDYLEGAQDADPTQTPWAVRAPRRPQQGFDVKLVARSPSWQDDPSFAAAQQRLEREPWIRVAGHDAGGVQLALDDAWIESTGAGLEAGGSAEAALADLAHGKRYSVQFWDANATKALHVGHLRNLATGNAIAAALAQAGATVERRSLISDVGRSMGEAMAGVQRSGRLTGTWSDSDEKSDHFVGLCYADYVAGSLAAGQEDAEDSQTRELTLRHDAADDLLKRALSGDREALTIWYKTRAWVIAGQRKTLARLGVAFDRVFFESDFLPDVVQLTAAGLENGTLRRREDGVVVWPSGIDGFEEFPLVRPDGVPTQHMRALVYWNAAPDLGDMTSMQICGSEWVGHATCRRALMEVLRSQNGANGGGMHPTHDIHNAMVGDQKRALASSDGALLIDDVIDWLDEQLESDPEGRRLRRAHPAPERIAPQIALGYFLPHPVAKPMDFDRQRLLREQESVGWDLVRARTRRSRVPVDGVRPAEDPEYRFAVVQSELYRRHLRLAVERLDVTQLALYLKHLAHWHLERDRGEHVERVVQTVLDRSARGLGLEAR